MLYLCNILKEDNYLVKSLVTASRKVMTRNWLETHPPRQKQLLEIVQEIPVTEKMTYSLSVKEDDFNRKWKQMAKV